MMRPNILTGTACQWRRCVLPLAVKTGTAIRSTHMPRTFCKTAVYNIERHWWPYELDVGINYQKIKSNRIRGKLEQISSPVGMAQGRIKSTVENIPARFRTVCIDTAAELPEEVRTKMPTILCIHGSGGSHEDFYPLLKNLVNDHGFRAVCFNWPGYGKTRGFARRDDAMFQFRSEETINFLLSFLKEIKLDRLDIVLGHSVGCVAASYICARGEQPSSLALIAPVPSQPYRGVQPIALLKTIGKLWKVKILRPFVQFFVQIGYARRGFSIKDPIHAVNATLMGAGVNFDLIERLAMELEMKKIPKLVIYGEKDGVIEADLLSEFASKIGVKNECFDVYDGKVQLAKQGSSPSDYYSRGILFEEGGHSPHLKEEHIPILTKEILALYDSTQKNS